MKELMKQIIEIIERNEGKKEITEKEIKVFLDKNKSKFEEERDKMGKAVDNAVKSISDPMDINAVMNAMLGTISSFMGEENFNRMSELERKYPFVKDMTKNILPQGNK